MPARTNCGHTAIRKRGVETFTKLIANMQTWQMVAKNAASIRVLAAPDVAAGRADQKSDEDKAQDERNDARDRESGIH